MNEEDFGKEVGVDIATRLRKLRRAKRINQSYIADNLGLSVSEISRIERGRRRLRVDQLSTWAKSLGYRIELIFWEDENQGESEGMDEEERALLREVASAVHFMPGPAREALIHEMALWRQEGSEAK